MSWFHSSNQGLQDNDRVLLYVQALDNAPSLNGKSGLVNFLVSEQSNYNILSKCPATTS